MPFMNLVVMVVIVLAIAVVMLSLFAIVTRILANRREARIDRDREIMLAVVRPYLAGEATLAQAVSAAPPGKDVALGVLLTAAVDLPAEHFPALHALAERLGLHRRELEALRHRDWTRRAHAATRLGMLRYPGAAPALALALEDAMLDVRLGAAHALAQLKAADAVEPILRALALPVSWPLQRCAEILYEMGPGATGPLLAVLQGRGISPAATAVAVKVLGMLKAREALPALVRTLQDTDDEIRVSSAKALGQIGAVEAGRPLREALNDTQWPVRSAAAAALGLVRDRNAVAALALRLADPAWWVRFNAAESLYRLNAEAELRSAMGTHADKFARDISRQVLEQYGAVSATATLAVAGAAP